MSADNIVSADVRELAELLADRMAQQTNTALIELAAALAPAKKVRNDAAQVTTFRTIQLEDGTTTVRPTQILGRGDFDNRARVQIWCGTGNVVRLGRDRGAVQNLDTCILLIPNVPVTLLTAQDLWVQSADAAATVTMVVEEYDEP